jgi:predicted double-glycine peptidase
VLIGLSLVGQAAGAPSRAWAQYTRAPARDPEHIFQRGVCSWTELKQRNVVMQKRDFSCGAASLATLLRYFWGDKVTEDMVLKEIDKMLTVKEAKDRLENGLTMNDLKMVSRRMGYESSSAKLTFDKLTESKVPVIVGLSDGRFDHFVVYRGTFGEYVYFADPVRGNWRQLITDFVKQWQKNAILIVAKKGVEPPKFSALTVRQDEVELGWLNRLEVQKRLSKF